MGARPKLYELPIYIPSGSAALRNCDKWYGSDYDLYYKEIEKMKDLVTARGQWMDSHFADQIQLVISKG